MKRTGLLVLGLAVVSINLGGCASVAREVVRQVIEKQEDGDEDTRGDKDSGEDSRKEASGGGEDNRDRETGQGGENSNESNEDDRKNSAGSSSGSFEQFIRDELEPRLGTAKNSQFSYGFERYSPDNSDYYYARPMTADLDSGIISTCLRDLNKDGRDELLVAYVEGNRQSSDGRNHFLLSVYGNSGSEITEWGRIGFDDCFSGTNGEEYLFGLKDVGDKRLVYAGGSSHVWTWADGSNPEIHLYQLENGQLREIYQVSTGGSDDSWMPRWRSELQGMGFDLPAMDWSETNLAGESGFEVLAYGECYTKDQGNGSTYGQQQYWIDYGLIIGGFYGADSPMVMQMNQEMRPYSGGSSFASSGSQGNYNTAGTAGTVNSSGAQGSISPGQAYGTGDYILPNSSSTYLTRADLSGLTQEQLRLARNEIYARHGRKFKTKELQDYFNSKSWYTGTIESNAFKDDYLNMYEKENIKLIQSLEN